MRRLRTFYYWVKPAIPRRAQIILRRAIIRKKLEAYKDTWPVDRKAGVKPSGWPGWPDGKKFALVLTHDVDTSKGQQRCYELMDLETRLGFRSSFNFVPERYRGCPFLRRELWERRFEVGVHGLYHDGKLYNSRELFQTRALLINKYLRDWEAVGFRSPAMHHNLNWLNELDIEYDSSTFDTDPFEPQSDGIGTIFPFLANGLPGKRGYVELPYTLPQDFTLFILLREKSIGIWKQKLEWLATHGGMALLNTHPDYMNFDEKSPTIEEYPAEYYRRFLEFVKGHYDDEYWQALPREVAQFWRKSVSNYSYER